MTLLIGQTTSGTTADFVGSGEGVAYKFTAAATGSAVTIRLQTKVANPEETQIEIGIYNDGGTRPSTKITSATIANPTGTGEVSVALTASIVNGTAYWLAYTHTNAATFDWQGNASGGYRWYNMAGVLPASWSASDNAGTQGPPILYIDGTVADTGAIEPRRDFEPVRFGPF